MRGSESLKLKTRDSTALYVLLSCGRGHTATTSSSQQRCDTCDCDLHDCDMKTRDSTALYVRCPVGRRWVDGQVGVEVHLLWHL